MLWAGTGWINRRKFSEPFTAFRESLPELPLPTDWHCHHLLPDFRDSERLTPSTSRSSTGSELTGITNTSKHLDRTNPPRLIAVEICSCTLVVMRTFSADFPRDPVQSGERILPEHSVNDSLSLNPLIDQPLGKNWQEWPSLVKSRRMVKISAKNCRRVEILTAKALTEISIWEVLGKSRSRFTVKLTYRDLDVQWITVSRDLGAKAPCYRDLDSRITPFVHSAITIEISRLGESQDLD
ncbi:hypothetical protein C8F01DRAFT_1087130 [Mycena amicta]|nr:hypothetical protein C8F01DRAFT_1087130 [Mycena amicta]